MLVWLRKDIEAVLFGTIVRKFMRLGSIMSKCLKASRYTLQKGLYVNLTIILGRYGNKLPPAIRILSRKQLSNIDLLILATLGFRIRDEIILVYTIIFIGQQLLAYDHKI